MTGAKKTNAIARMGNAIVVDGGCVSAAIAMGG
jgi:hypothetical protein